MPLPKRTVQLRRAAKKRAQRTEAASVSAAGAAATAAEQPQCLWKRWTAAAMCVWRATEQRKREGKRR